MWIFIALEVICLSPWYSDLAAPLVGSWIVALVVKHVVWVVFYKFSFVVLSLYLLLIRITRKYSFFFFLCMLCSFKDVGCHICLLQQFPFYCDSGIIYVTEPYFGCMWGSAVISRVDSLSQLWILGWMFLWLVCILIILNINKPCFILNF